jgi:predicted dienelactone hydrolase
MSHGLLNWAAAMTYLAEHLASRGYAVLGLEHEDEAAVHPLAAALLLRPLDQAGAVNLLIRLEAAPDHPLHQRLDLDRVGLIGFSMGGYGALVTAGARVNSDSLVWRQLSPDAQAQHAQPMSAAAASVRARIGAVVAIAPWGGQTAVGVLRPAGLTGVQAPTLVVAGDQDDISGYADGVRSLWAQLPATPRWLLVYENARHNIGLQGAPDNLQGTFAAWSAFEEPVWRRDRILDINRHFVTAFLDLTLRGQSERAVFLQSAVSRASEGQWPEPFGTPATGRFAGAPRGDITHWAGFQRRWAVGLRLEQHAPAPRAP